MRRSWFRVRRRAGGCDRNSNRKTEALVAPIKRVDESGVVQFPEIVKIPKGHGAHLFRFRTLETA